MVYKKQTRAWHDTLYWELRVSGFRCRSDREEKAKGMQCSRSALTLCFSREMERFTNKHEHDIHGRRSYI